MSERALRWGLLSTARINRALIPPLRASQRNQLTTVASRSLEAAQAYAGEWEIPRALGSYEALIEDPEIDVIYNPLPNHLHAEWTVRALRAGKHVLCEKPLALTLDEVDRMAEAARATGRIAAEAFMYRHHPQTLKVKELIEAGAIGRPLLIKGAFTFTLTRTEDYRLSPEMGGGSLWDVGCYPISFARLIAGAEPLEVFGWQVRGPTGIDETFIGQLRFRGDILAQFDCGFASPYRAHIEIIGTSGVLEVPVPFKPGSREEIHLTRGDEPETIEINGPELYVGEVEDMADAVLLGKPPRVSLADSRGNVAAILALLESARVGKPVSVG
jgi:xylose dehydrogenase (NAD/NADP)